MMFWIVAGIMTLLTVGLTIYPVFGKVQTPGSALDYDKEIYKARLAEIEAERKLGKISEEAYEYTLAEEGRRFLKQAALSTSSPSSQKSKSIRFAGIVFATLTIPAIAMIGYSQWGASALPDQPLLSRLSADPKGQSVQVLLKRAENQLAKNPSDGRGWLVVAPVYMRLGRTQDAANAYKNAIRTMGATPDLQVSLGETLAILAGGVVTEEARTLFSRAIIADPDNFKASFFLAIALNQGGQFQQAISAWDILIKKSPPNAPWLAVARQQLRMAQNKLGIKAPGNPTAEDVEAAGELSVGDRKEFINSMVERLAEELTENPKNKPGWQRIIRSYSVLGRKEDALAAIKKAQEIFKDDKEFLSELSKNQQSLNQ